MWSEVRTFLVGVLVVVTLPIWLPLMALMAVILFVRDIGKLVLEGAGL